MNRLQWADGLRAIAAVVVCWSHLVEGRTEVSDVLRMSFAQTAVDCFFLLSGFLVPAAALGRSSGQFLAGRVLRLWPTWAAATCLGSLVIVLMGGQFGWQPFACSMALGVGDYFGGGAVDNVVWTLHREARACLLLAFLAQYLVTPTWTLRALMFLWPFGVLAGYHGGYVGDVFCTDCEVFCLMLAGHALANRATWGFWRTTGVVLVCLSGSTVCSLAGPWAGFPVIMLLPKFVSVVVLLLLFRWPYCLSWAAPAAFMSYSLYCLHRPLGLSVMVSLADWPDGVACFASFVVVAAGSWVLWALVERPSLELSRLVVRTWPTCREWVQRRVTREACDEQERSGLDARLQDDLRPAGGEAAMEVQTDRLRPNAVSAWLDE